MTVNNFSGAPSGRLKTLMKEIEKSEPLSEKTSEKLQRLERLLQENAPVAIALSGGVDSTFLVRFAKEILQENIVAVTAKCDNFAPDELEYSDAFCRENGIAHIFASIPWETLEPFYSNPSDRCYICKRIMLGQIDKALKKWQPGTKYRLADGTNASDSQDYRPGLKALEEMSVLSPLKLAGLEKEEIRVVMHRMNMAIWDKPAFACLASRIPYGEEITREKLRSIYSLECYLRDLGFRQVRVRCHAGGVARIEVVPADLHRFFNEDFMSAVNSMAIKSGFAYAALDLVGYKMGNLNRNL